MWGVAMLILSLTLMLLISLFFVILYAGLLLLLALVLAHLSQFKMMRVGLETPSGGDEAG